MLLGQIWKTKSTGMVDQDISLSEENFEILQPIILVCRILGILPVRFIRSGNFYKLKKSLIYAIYSYILMVFLSVATIFGIVNDLQKDELHSVRMGNKKTRFVTSCDISIVIIIVFFSTITIPFKLKKFWKFMQCLNQIDSIIPLTKQNRFRQSSLFFMTMTFIVTMLIFTFDIVVWTNTTAKKIKDSTCFFKNYITFYVLYLIIVTQEVLFWHLIFFVKIRICTLNKNLQYIGNESFDTLHKKFSVRDDDNKVRIGQLVVGDVLDRTENVKDDPSKNRNVRNSSLLEKVNALIKFEEKIFEAIQSINSSCGYGIHLITLSCLLHLIVTPYFLLTEIMKQDGNVFFISLQSAWLLAHIGRLLIIVEPCQQCLDEHRTTSTLLCELLTKNFDEEIKKSLTIFTIQLNYCEIQFTPCGFFKINRSLMTSIAAAVSTYLVILFQFNPN